MPVYEFCCDSCMHRFELKRSFHDNTEVACPRCSSAVRQVYSPAPVIFKGSGFYVTDVKRPQEKSAEPTAVPKPAEEKKPEKVTEPAVAKKSAKPTGEAKKSAG